MRRVPMLIEHEYKAVLNLIEYRTDALAGKPRMTPKEEAEWRFLTDAAEILRQQREHVNDNLEVVSRNPQQAARDAEARSKTRARQRTAQKIRSQQLAKRVEVGDLIKVRGARDGKGYRVVLEVKKHDLVCRKVVKDRFTNVFEPDYYITQCGKDKVAEIIIKGWHA